MKCKPYTYLIAVILFALALTAGNASAVPLILDYTGFSWFSGGGADPSHFWAAGVVDGFSLPINDPASAYTYYFSNLDLSYVDNPNAQRRTYTYSGGNLGVYRSTTPANRGYEYGVDPSNPTCPSTFVDGSLWLGGALGEFSLYVDDILHLGTITSSGVFSSGEFAAALGQNTFFTFSGLTSRPGNGIPRGYSYRMDGELDLTMNPPVPEPATIVLLGGGVLGLAGLLRRKRNH